MWFREWRRQRKFTKAWRQVIQERFSEGHIGIDDYHKGNKAADSPKTMKALMAQTETAPGLYGGISDWDWESILRWINEFFIPLMRTLLPLLLLLDEEK